MQCCPQRIGINFQVVSICLQRYFLDKGIGRTSHTANIFWVINHIEIKRGCKHPPIIYCLS